MREDLTRSVAPIGVTSKAASGADVEGCLARRAHATALRVARRDARRRESHADASNRLRLLWIGFVGSPREAGEVSRLQSGPRDRAPRRRAEGEDT